jgi:hypothetical protein
VAVPNLTGAKIIMKIIVLCNRSIARGGGRRRGGWCSRPLGSTDERGAEKYSVKWTKKEHNLNEKKSILWSHTKKIKLFRKIKRNSINNFNFLKIRYFFYTWPLAITRSGHQKTLLGHCCENGR